MALKDLVIDNAEREAMRLVEPYAHQLWPRDVRQLTDNIANSLRTIAKERDDALLAADIVRDLATPPISDADVEMCIAEACRVKHEIEEAPRNTSQPYWKPGDLFRFWNSHPNTVYTILRFHKSRRPDDPVDWRERAEAIAADVQVANLGDGTLERVPVVILNSAQVCKVEA